MTELRLLLAAVALSSLIGCGGGDSSSPAPGRGPNETAPATELPPSLALCTHLGVDVTGQVDTGAATELSGLALSRSQPNVLWTQNDSGNPARVFAVRPDGRLLADLAVTGAENVDWEDIAVGPEPGGDDALYLADIGDNLAGRSDVAVYRVPEPRLVDAEPDATAPAQRFTLRYPDRPHDAEALLVDPSGGALVIVTKELEGPAHVYAAPIPSAAATLTLRRAGEAQLGNGNPVTGGSVAANGRTIALRTYDRVFVWSRHRGESVAAALRRPPCAAGADLLDEGQGEALALTPDGQAFYTVPEGEHPALRRYAPAG
jgi:hypothetical protein